MSASVETEIADYSRSRLIAGCGVIIVLLSAGSALLPVVDRDAGAKVVGLLLFFAGLVEAYAGMIHRQARGLSVLAGAVTTVAGMLFIFNPEGQFFPAAFLVIGWLLLRSIILLLAGLSSIGSVKMWTLVAAAMDFFLAVVLLMGLSMSMLVVALFGPTSQVVAAFAWVLALSFVVTGGMLLEIARCDRRSLD